MPYRLLVCVLLVAATSRVSAQRAFDLQLFQPAPGPLAALSLPRATPLPHGQFLLGASLSYAYGLLARRVPCRDEPGCAGELRRTEIVSDLTQAEASVAVGLYDRVELGAVLPLSTLRAADQLAARSTFSRHSGLADLRLAGKIALLRGRHALSLVMTASLPAGDADQLRGDRRWTATPSLVLGLFTDARGDSLLSIAIGYRLRPSERPPGLSLEVDDELDGGVALALPAAPWLRVLAELRVRAGVGGRTLRSNEVPLELDVGARAMLSPGLALFAGAGSGVWPARDAYGAPDYRVLAGVRGTLAPAHCSGGTCARADRDADGIADAADGCPDTPEDHDAFLDRDGCPDPDNDADGIPDGADACPSETEDRDGFEDGDGCPEPDNDADGLLDGLDECAMDPEDVDDFEDEDGCPEPGPEPARIAVIEGRILVSERVFFEFESDTIRSVSMPLLDQLAAVIRELPKDTVVQIEGHTDDTGNAAYNLDLSYRRAAAVAAYLRSRGVSRGALRAMGHGARHPVADNDSPEGRALNRRVEFTLHKR